MSERERTGWWHTRRRFLRGTMVGAGAMSIGMLDRCGGARPAEAGPMVCRDPSGFKYRTTGCIPPAYATDCSRGGCYREGQVSHPVHCPSNGGRYRERHRTCGENVSYNGVLKQFTLRSNACGDDYDGWEWLGTDVSRTCGCGGGRTVSWSCNDGYVRERVNGEWSEWCAATCMTHTCRERDGR